MELMKKLLKDRRFHRLAGGALVLGAGAVLLAWRMGVDLATLKEWWKVTEDFLKAHPWWLFAALVVLPGLPMPTSALMVLAGTVWSERPVMACGLALLALALNMSWTYWLAARPGRGLVEKLLAAGTLRVPELPRGNDLRLLLVLRLTPGVPLFFQNYLLGFFRVPFPLYLPVSLACTGLISCGIVLSGAGVAGGNLAPMFTGLGLIVLGVVVVQVFRRKFRVSG
jgi:uncharacterized membrane protein YdjX (TVP38/TMEM64 family)